MGFGAVGGGRQFTRLARLRIRELGAVINEGDLRSCVFLTGTIPGGTAECYQAVAAWSGWIVQAVSQWLRDNWQDVKFFGVWEYQKRGALHLHVCVRTTDERQANEVKRAWKRRWLSCLNHISRQVNFDFWQRASGSTWQFQRSITRTDAQTVEKGVDRYLSKYLSKQQKNCGKYSQFPPSSYWFASLNLRQEAKARRLETVSRVAHPSVIFDALDFLASKMADCTKRVYACRSDWEPATITWICLIPPAVAGVMYREFCAALRAWQLIPSAAPPERLASIVEVMFEFCGSRICAVA